MSDTFELCEGCTAAAGCRLDKTCLRRQRSEERTPVRSGTFVSRPTLRPDTSQDAPLAERSEPDVNCGEYTQIKDKIAAYSHDELVSEYGDLHQQLYDGDVLKVAAVMEELYDRLTMARAVANASIDRLTNVAKELNELKATN